MVSGPAHEKLSGAELVDPVVPVQENSTLLVAFCAVLSWEPCDKDRQHKFPEHLFLTYALYQ